MRTTMAVLTLVTLASSPARACQETGATPAPADPKQSIAGHSYVRPFEGVEFHALNPAMSPGAQMAILWGDPKTGPSAVLFKMGRGATPLHTHSSTYHLVVIQGTMKHWAQGESEKDAASLGPGSYWYIEGNKVHADSCLSEECLAFIRWDGKRDGKLLP